MLLLGRVAIVLQVRRVKCPLLSFRPCLVVPPRARVGVTGGRTRSHEWRRQRDVKNVPCLWNCNRNRTEKRDTETPYFLFWFEIPPIGLSWEFRSWFVLPWLPLSPHSVFLVFSFLFNLYKTNEKESGSTLPSDTNTLRVSLTKDLAHIETPILKLDT